VRTEARAQLLFNLAPHEFETFGVDSFWTKIAWCCPVVILSQIQWPQRASTTRLLAPS